MAIVGRSPAHDALEMPSGAVAGRPTYWLGWCTTPIADANICVPPLRRSVADAIVVSFVGSPGDGYDDALAERTIGLYKAELIHAALPERVDDLEIATTEWVGWYNSQRIRSRFQYLPNALFEALCRVENSSATFTQPGNAAPDKTGVVHCSAAQAYFPASFAPAARQVRLLLAGWAFPLDRWELSAPFCRHYASKPHR